ncbi:ATP-binding protein [Mucilaginibacter psychrotolerans]|uniref:ATP-binding protein n=1 Tax=Mucilaginibacter psychrotolerans TaxID=1524096 RepID=A0A4Y8SAS2_9SPHI|nr:ATP-binding protein [Mucilaginibacter psychrotolerans]TFF35735.1 ATP-binding protein [Mucilaginibacter psychrotolerans]
MMTRFAEVEIALLMQEFPAVGLLGPRQIGKATLAEHIALNFDSSLYLDLESPADLAKLSEPEDYFERHKGKLIILDEVQRVPELFGILRGVIDRRRKDGLKKAQFVILGSASLELLKQSETLAGRIAYINLAGINVKELLATTIPQHQLWLRGGFPDSLLANSDDASLRWRLNFITTYLERDVPQFGPRIPSVTLRRLWTMLAHNHGGQLNIAQLGANLDLSGPTVKRYIELLEDLLLIRSIRPWFGNVGKRLVKAPKVYIRDSGLVHALLNLKTLDEVLSHPVIGASWEGFVIENIISCLPQGVTYWFYRTSAGAEIDLVVEKSNTNKFAIEIKRSLTPTVSKGFYLACEDIAATHRFVVYPGGEKFLLSKGVYAISLIEMMDLLTQI